MGKNKGEDFKLPEGYFANFNARLQERMKAEVEDEALSFLPKSDGFKVPDGYFDQLSEQLKQKLEPKETKVINLRTYRKVAYSVAAVAAIFILVFSLRTPAEASVEFSDLANAEIASYFEDTQWDVTTAELAEIIPVEEVELADLVETDLESENILEYLDENIEDIDEIDLNFETYEE
ncbi:MAG: hypothetical protein AAFU57_01040 [Bacteroidota bacterium]